jgi:hypothetical protein
MAMKKNPYLTYLAAVLLAYLAYRTYMANDMIASFLCVFVVAIIFLDAAMIEKK